MTDQAKPPYRPCALCTSAYPDMADDICDGHSASSQALALQLAWMVQEELPTPEQTQAMLDDALETIDWISDRGSWVVERTGMLDHDPLWTVNGIGFRLRYDCDGNPMPIPNPPTGTCPECGEDVGRDAFVNLGPPRSVRLECLGCFHAWDVEPWWTPVANAQPGGAS